MRKSNGKIVPFRKPRRQPKRRRPSWLARFLKSWWVPLAVASIILGLMAYQTWDRPWALQEKILHSLAAPNCAAARAMGLAPARKGRPGYYQRHDADGDGIACEPFPRN